MTANPKAMAAIRDQKAPLDLLEILADEDCARALKTGAVKYGKQNYRQVETHLSTYLAAAMRHLKAYTAGQDNDPESGLCHLAHVQACMHVIYGSQDSGNMTDDRGPQPLTPEQEAMSAANNQAGGVKPVIQSYTDRPVPSREVSRSPTTTFVACAACLSPRTCAVSGCRGTL
jgi:hypothetical protein